MEMRSSWVEDWCLRKPNQWSDMVEEVIELISLLYMRTLEVQLRRETGLWLCLMGVIEWICHSIWILCLVMHLVKRKWRTLYAYCLRKMVLISSWPVAFELLMELRVSKMLNLDIL